MVLATLAHPNCLFDRSRHKREQKGCPCDGVWIPFDPSQGEYSLGRVQYSEEERGKYALRRYTSTLNLPIGAHIITHEGELGFPNGSGENGYVVGLTVRCQGPGISGAMWFLADNLKLGEKAVRMRFRYTRPDGMDKTMSTGVVVGNLDFDLYYGSLMRLIVRTLCLLYPCYGI